MRRRREERATIWRRGCRRAPPDRSPQPPWLPGQPPRVPGMERNLAMELVRVTEAAALASARLMGRGDEMAADVAAIEAMRTAFDAIAIDGTVVIGEGAEDAMPKLYVGERVGTGQGPATDVALDALEGAAICAAGGYNALSVIAIAEHGTFLRVPDTYMDKIACGPEGRGAIDLDKRPRDNLKALADARGVYVEDLTVAILDRPRHNALIEEVRRAGARIKLITSGDVSAALATTRPDTGIDLLMGVGGAHRALHRGPPPLRPAAGVLSSAGWGCTPRHAAIFLTNRCPL